MFKKSAIYKKATRLELDTIYIAPELFFLYEFLPTGANNPVLQKPLGLFLERMKRIPYKIRGWLKIIAYISVFYLAGRHGSNISRYPKDFKMKSHGVNTVYVVSLRDIFAFLAGHESSSVPGADTLVTACTEGYHSPQHQRERFECFLAASAV